MIIAIIGGLVILFAGLYSNSPDKKPDPNPNYPWVRPHYFKMLPDEDYL